MVVGHRAVGIAVELCKLVHILPHSLVVGVENMGTVAVDMDALHALGVDVARNVVPLINDEAALACLFGLMGKHRAVQARAHDEIIILLHGLLSFFFGSAFASEEVFF